MSLINEVLRDLEATRPNEQAWQNLQREIRVLPATGSPRRARSVMLWGGLALILGGAAFSLVTYWPTMLTPVLSSPVVVPPSAAVSVPLPATPSPSVPVPEDSPAVPLAMPAPARDDTELQAMLAAAVAPLPSVILSKPVPVAQVPAPVPIQQPVAKASLSSKAAVPVVSASTAEAAGGLSEPAAKIEKRPPQHVLRDPVEYELHKAETAVAEGRPDEAAMILLQALERDRRSVPLRQALVRTLLAQKRFDEAMNRLSVGVGLMPEQTGWALTLARLQLDRNDLPAAIRTLETSRAYATSNADYAGFFGYLKSRQGEQREAGAYYLQAARLAPQEGRWWLGLGLALAADGKTVESREAMRRALASGSLSADLRQLAEQHVQAAPASN